LKKKTGEGTSTREQEKEKQEIGKEMGKEYLKTRWKQGDEEGEWTASDRYHYAKSIAKTA
jgi:hypothetical protein